MKLLIRLLLVTLLGLTVAASAWADRGHGHGHGYARFGVVVNPWAWSYPYAYSPYYYPPTYYAPVMVNQPPVVYVEQAAQAPAPVSNYWYFCRSAKAYYPYVKECREGWQPVAAQPPGQP